MKKIIAMLLCVVCFTSCADENDTTTDNIIKIAVIKNSGTQYEYFEKGIDLAYREVSEEYKDSGYVVECNFYDNDGTNEGISAITERLANDPSVSVIIGSSDNEIAKNQSLITQNSEKILVCPGWVNDDNMTSSNDMVFSVIYSNDDMAVTIKSITESLPEMNWAVCAPINNITFREIQYFKKKETKNVVDYCDIDDLEIYFDKIKKRWESLDVKGIVFQPYSEDDIDVLLNIKKEMPDIYIVSDFDMDSWEKYDQNPQMFENVYIADGFFVDKSDEKYKAEKEKFEDTWMTHGYNTFKMLADTAVKNNTADPRQIAKILHTNGYSGIGEEFNFADNGVLIPTKYNYIDMGALEEHAISPETEGK